jgi:hypothetical protein
MQTSGFSCYGKNGIILTVLFLTIPQFDKTHERIIFKY